jgi:glutamyl-Q tRNA(Asp) synthetase
VYQSRRHEAYQAALEQLRALGSAYECSCSRRELGGAVENLAGDGVVYPGYCRSGPRHAGPTATRLRLPSGLLDVSDRLRGTWSVDFAQLGDPVIRRRDGITAYQLAVVVDDHWQRISSVVRGEDLLPSTGWQVQLQRVLGYATPRYLHLPLVVEADGSKLAKSRRSLPVEALDPGLALLQSLRLLRQNPPDELRNAPAREVLRWAIPNWRPEFLKGNHLLALHSDW